MADPSKADTTMNTTNKDDLLALNDLSFAVLPLVQEMMDCAQHGRADALLQYRQAVFQQLDAIKAYAEAADGKDIALSAQEGEIDLLREKIQSKGNETRHVLTCLEGLEENLKVSLATVTKKQS